MVAGPFSLDVSAGRRSPTMARTSNRRSQKQRLDSGPTLAASSSLWSVNATWRPTSSRRLRRRHREPGQHVPHQEHRAARRTNEEQQEAEEDVSWTAHPVSPPWLGRAHQRSTRPVRDSTRSGHFLRRQFLHCKKGKSAGTTLAPSGNSSRRCAARATLPARNAFRAALSSSELRQAGR